MGLRYAVNVPLLSQLRKVSGVTPSIFDAPLIERYFISTVQAQNNAERTRIHADNNVSVSQRLVSISQRYLKTCQVVNAGYPQKSFLRPSNRDLKPDIHKPY